MHQLGRLYEALLNKGELDGTRVLGVQTVGDEIGITQDFGLAGDVGIAAGGTESNLGGASGSGCLGSRDLSATAKPPVWYAPFRARS